MSAHSPRTISIVGVPMDLGTHLRGVDMGPSAIRIAGLREKLQSLGLRVRDTGNLHVPHAHAEEGRATRTGRRRQYAPLVAKVCRSLQASVAATLGAGETPLVLGGDHSIAMGTLAGVWTHARKKKLKTGLLWVDAHGDCNTPQTSPSGNIHGMPLAVALGRGAAELLRLARGAKLVDPAHTVLMGARDLDPGERDNIRRFGIRVYTMREIDERGVRVCMAEALDRVSASTDGFHLSFDIDSLDPSVAPGVGTPVSGGLTIREAHLIMEMVADTRRMLSCELVEVNPALDQRNTTAWLATELLCSAFGASIL